MNCEISMVVTNEATLMSMPPANREMVACKQQLPMAANDETFILQGAI